MRATEREVATGDGVTLVERRWLPDGDAKATVVIVHGYGEHAGRYEHVARALTGAGYAVHAADLRGHGRSGGPRVLVRSVDQYLDDLARFLVGARAEAGGRPLFLLGHSMGGTIVTSYVLSARPQPSALVLSGPGLGGTAGGGLVERIATWLIGVVGRVAPRLRLGKLDSALVSRDAAVVAAYDADPLVYHGRFKAGLARALTSAVRDIRRRMEEVALPLLIMHGTEDGLTDPEASRTLHDRARSSDKTLKLYEGLRHEIFNEPEQDAVLADLVAWLDERV